MGHLTKENVRTVEQRRSVMYHTLFYICSKRSSMCQKRNNECTIQLTIYTYTHIFIPQNHVFPLENVSVEFICIPNGIPVHTSIHCIRNTLFLLVGNLDFLSLSLRQSHRRTATIRRLHLTFLLLLRIFVVVPVTTDGAPSARPACPDSTAVTTTTTTLEQYIYYIY